MVFAANVRNVFGVLLGCFFHSVDLEQQDRGTIERETGVNVGFDGAKRPAVEHFARGRSDPARGDVDHGFGGVVQSFKNSQERLHGLGKTRELNGDFGNQRKSAFRADKKTHQIVTGGIECQISDPNEFAGGKNGFEGQRCDW